MTKDYKADELRSILKEEIEKSHMAISATQSNLMGSFQKEIKDMRVDIKELRTDVEPVIDAYRFASTGRAFVINTAKLIAAIGTVGAAIIYALKGWHY